MAAATHSLPALVVGGAGALGKAAIKHLKEHHWRVINVAFHPEETADHNIVLKHDESWQKQLDGLHEAMAKLDSGASPKLGAVVCTAGGWAGGSIQDRKLPSAVASMHSMCLESSLTAAQLASLYMQPGGTLVLTGSAAALGPAPGMLAYGLSKASVHTLVQWLAAAGPAEGLPAGSRVVGILPKVIDTPSNRQYMAGPGVDTSSWTPLSHLGEALAALADGAEGRCREEAAEGLGQLPVRIPSGALLVAETAGGKTSWDMMK